MRVLMLSEEDIEVSDFEGSDFEIESTSPEVHFSALQMFATSVALCTYSVLVSYADQIDVASDEISIRMRWSYGEKPFRIGWIQMDVNWPGLPESRLAAARRAATMCTLHHTLAKPPEFVTRVNE